MGQRRAALGFAYSRTTPPCFRGGWGLYFIGYTASLPTIPASLSTVAPSSLRWSPISHRPLYGQLYLRPGAPVGSPQNHDGTIASPNLDTSYATRPRGNPRQLGPTTSGMSITLHPEPAQLTGEKSTSSYNAATFITTRSARCAPTTTGNRTCDSRRSVDSPSLQTRSPAHKQRLPPPPLGHVHTRDLYASARSILVVDPVTAPASAGRCVAPEFPRTSGTFKKKKGARRHRAV